MGCSYNGVSTAIASCSVRPPIKHDAPMRGSRLPNEQGGSRSTRSCAAPRRRVPDVRVSGSDDFAYFGEVTGSRVTGSTVDQLWNVGGADLLSFPAPGTEPAS